LVTFCWMLLYLFCVGCIPHVASSSSNIHTTQHHGIMITKQILCCKCLDYQQARQATRSTLAPGNLEICQLVDPAIEFLLIILISIAMISTIIPSSLTFSPSFGMVQLFRRTQTRAVISSILVHSYPTRLLSEWIQHVACWSLH
jgi:hypothetical protein